MSDVESFLAGNGALSTACYALGRFVLAGLVRIWTRMKIEGRHNVPRSGAFILAPVHRSYVDTPIAAGVTRRRMRFMGKDTLWKYRWSGWIMSAVGAFPVSRGTADREALRRCEQVLATGEPLVLFPEGERKSGPVVQPLYDGAAYLALRTGVPIVPVGIGGSERVMPKGARFVYPRTVRVIVGAPIVPPARPDGGRVPRGAVHELSAELHDTLQRLFDAAQLAAGTPNSR